MYEATVQSTEGRDSVGEDEEDEVDMVWFITACCFVFLVLLSALVKVLDDGNDNDDDDDDNCGGGDGNYKRMRMILGIKGLYFIHSSI